MENFSVWEIQTKSMTAEQKQNCEMAREFVMSCLHHSGINKKKLSPMIWCRAYLLCDGFGEIDSTFARECDWDWSHVRDSSPEAILRVHKYLWDNVNF